MYLCVNKKFIVLLAVIALVLLLFPLSLEAATVISGDTLNIGREEIIDDDVYLFGDTVTISGTILGDAVIFCREAIVDGVVEGSLLVFAETIRFNGEVLGSLRGGTNTFNFQGSTGRDLMIMANRVNMNGPVGTDFFVGANSVLVTAPVGRSIRASAGSMVIDAPVGGDIHAYVGDLIFSSGAVVEGQVDYTSDKEAKIDPQATIMGALTRYDPPTDAIFQSPGRRAWGFIRPLLSLMAAALLMTLLFPGITGGTAEAIKTRPGASAGCGALMVFVTPIAALLLLITVIGAPISLMTMLLYIVLLYLSRVFAGYFLARLIFDRLDIKLHPVWTGMIGVLILGLLVKIPFVGWLIHLAATIFASGAFMLYLLQAGKKEEEAPPVLDEAGQGS